MTFTYEDLADGVRIYCGDCLEVMGQMEPNSVHAIVTDPPYELGFMGKAWDKQGITHCAETWQSALRVAKPGAHLLAFGGTRTSHRLACALEDAGWEIRDTVMWVYGSGFPKSHDVSKAIDKAAGVERDTVGMKDNKGRVMAEGWGMRDDDNGDPITAPATPAAQQWQGWGTALKPAWEPVIVARKPLEGTVAANVQKWGTGAMNIDGCRVEVDPSVDDMLRTVERQPRQSQTWEQGSGFKNENNALTGVPSKGRWPANLIHDGSDEVLAGFPNGGAAAPVRGTEVSTTGQNGIYGHFERVAGPFHNDTGSAARFFYCSKASSNERNMGIDGATLELEVCLCGADMGRATSLARDISEYVTAMASKGCSTILSGNGSTAPLHRVRLSIMSTETSKITDSKTWSVSTSLPTSAFIAGVIETLQDNGSNLVGTVGSISQSLASMSANQALARGAKIAVSETPWKTSASAKPTASDHPTVKPISLMRYLCRLVTPPNGVILDPFMGSGSTGIAAVQEGFRFVGIELDAEYYDIAKRRISDALLQGRLL